MLCLRMHRCCVWCTDVNAANKSHMLLVAITALCFVILISGIGEVPTNLPRIRLRWNLKLTEKMEQGNSNWTWDTFVFDGSPDVSWKKTKNKRRWIKSLTIPMALLVLLLTVIPAFIRALRIQSSFLLGPISYSVWWDFLLHFPYHTSYNYSFQVQMWNVCSCITKDSEFLQVLAEVFESLMDWVSQHASTEWDSPGQYKADSVIIYIRHKHKKQFPSQQLTRTRLC